MTYPGLEGGYCIEEITYCSIALASWEIASPFKHAFLEQFVYCGGYTTRSVKCVTQDEQLYAASLDLFSVPITHSQTFENKSSFVANPVAGLVPAAGVAGAALLHPPKSSSALTLGGAWLAGANPPPPPGKIL